MYMVCMYRCRLAQGGLDALRCQEGADGMPPTRMQARMQARMLPTRSMSPPAIRPLLLLLACVEMRISLREELPLPV